MLVLSRGVDEALVIGRNVTVKVVEIRGQKVRLGITADPSIEVHREEVWVEIQARRGRRTA